MYRPNPSYRKVRAASEIVVANDVGCGLRYELADTERSDWDGMRHQLLKPP